MTTRFYRLNLAAFAAVALGLSACDKNPIERLVNPYGDAEVPGTTGVFNIFDEELKTGGGVAFIPGGENQTIDFSDKTSPRRTSNHVRYVWNGGDTAGATPGTTQHLFAGFLLLSQPTAVDNDALPGRDLTPAGYTKLKFWVRGELSQENTLRVEGPDDGSQATTTARVEFTGAQLAQGWQEVTLNVPPSDFANVKTFITVSIQYTQPPRTTAAGEGGTVFFDDIRYE